MKTSPLVSWLMCTHVFNDNFVRAVNSCLEQTYTNFEFILVCNGPDANEIFTKVKELYGNEKRINVIVTDISHLTFSLNLGLHNARGEFIARMDSDDVAMPDRLKIQVEYLVVNPNVTVLGMAYEITDGFNSSQRIFLPSSNIDIRKALVYRNVIAHPTVMFRRSVIVKSGGYLGGIYSQDYDLWTRLLQDRNVVFCNLPLVGIQYNKQGVGNARGSRVSYANVAGCQLRAAISTRGIKWILSAVLTAFKGFISQK